MKANDASIGCGALCYPSLAVKRRPQGNGSASKHLVHPHKAEIVPQLPGAAKAQNLSRG